MVGKGHAYLKSIIPLAKTAGSPAVSYFGHSPYLIFGSYIAAVGVAIFLYCVFEAFQKKRVAGANPWGEGATTLEWQLPSPPPFHQWEQLPKIK